MGPFPVRDLLFVGLGGFVGSVARYLVSSTLNSPASATRLPLGTLVVNVTGCLAIGILAGISEQREWLAPPTRLLLMTGLVGGFTTYSAFALETYGLARGPSPAAAAANVILHLVLGIGAVWLGMRLAVTLAR